MPVFVEARPTHTLSTRREGQISNPSLLWRHEFDGRYVAEVHKTARRGSGRRRRMGVFSLFDHKKGELVGSPKTVTLPVASKLGAKHEIAFRRRVLRRIDEPFMREIKEARMEAKQAA